MILTEVEAIVDSSVAGSEYLKIIRSPAHRVSITKLRLGVHSLRIQTGKYENKGASIPVESRTCLTCKENYVDGEQHFVMYCQGYNNLRSELHSLISKSDAHAIIYIY